MYDIVSLLTSVTLLIVSLVLDEDDVGGVVLNIIGATFSIAGAIHLAVNRVYTLLYICYGLTVLHIVLAILRVIVVARSMALSKM